jgi:hypothetical protein
MFEARSNQISEGRFYFHLIKLILLVASLILSFIPNNIGAETFSWENKDGTLIYGSHPPPDAINLNLLETRELSRYSHEKAISGTRRMYQSDQYIHDNLDSLREVSLEEERVGHSVISFLSQLYPLDFDHPRRAEVDEVMLKLTDAIGASSQPWHVNVFKDPQVKSAGATSGNHVFIWTAMIDFTRNKDELAVILGHEVGHILAGHTTPWIEEHFRKAQKKGLSISAALGLFSAFSQDKELEADKIGLYLMAKAGYRPEAAIEFWERALHDPSFSTPAFISTHPPASERLDQMKGLIFNMNNGSMSHTPVSVSATQGVKTSYSGNQTPEE